MTLALNFNWKMEIVDVVTAFLYGDPEETIFMKIPVGLSKYTGKTYDENDCVVLDKSIYGLVQAARQFYKKTAGCYDKEIGF